MWQRLRSLLFADGRDAPLQMAFVRSKDWRNIKVEVEAVSLPSGERKTFHVAFLEGTCLLPWLPDAERVIWTLRDGEREAKVNRSFDEARDGGAVELVLVSER
jgi:hypothetical protein